MADELAKPPLSATDLSILVPFPSFYFSSLLLSELYCNYITSISDIQTSNPLKSFSIPYALTDFNYFFRTLAEPISEFLLYKIGLNQSPLYDLCHADEHDNYRIFCNLLLFYLIRSIHFKVFTLRPPSTFYPWNLLSFLLDSDLFNSFID